MSARIFERNAVVALQHAGVVGGHIESGRGVEIAADVLDLFGDALRRALRGALERHVLEQMR